MPSTRPRSMPSARPRSMPRSMPSRRPRSMPRSTFEATPLDAFGATSLDAPLDASRDPALLQQPKLFRYPWLHLHPLQPILQQCLRRFRLLLRKQPPQQQGQHPHKRLHQPRPVRPQPPPQRHHLRARRLRIGRREHPEQRHTQAASTRMLRRTPPRVKQPVRMRQPHIIRCVHRTRRGPCPLPGVDHHRQHRRNLHPLTRVIDQRHPALAQHPLDHRRVDPRLALHHQHQPALSGPLARRRPSRLFPMNAPARPYPPDQVAVALRNVAPTAHGLGIAPGAHPVDGVLAQGGAVQPPGKPRSEGAHQVLDHRRVRADAFEGLVVVLVSGLLHGSGGVPSCTRRPP